MPKLTRITHDARVMGGKACVRGVRVTVSTIVRLVAAGHSSEEILREYPYLQAGDIARALSYAAWRAAEVEVSLAGVKQRIRTRRPSTVASAPDSSYSG